MGLLISPEELADVLGDVTVLDVRYQLGRADGHEAVPRRPRPRRGVRRPGDRPRRPAGRPGRRGRTAPAAGPGPVRGGDAAGGRARATGPVVVYDDWGGMAATRAWWLLHLPRAPRRAGARRRLVGVEPVRRARSRPARPDAAAGDFRADPGHLPVVDADGAARVAREGVLLDARAPERLPRRDRAGRPGRRATCPGRSACPTDGEPRRRPVPVRSTTLATVYAADRRGRRRSAAYCGSGVTATHDLFALHLLGRRGALYPGSWSGWVADPRHPGRVRA